MTDAPVPGLTLQDQLLKLLARNDDSNTPHRLGAFSNAAVHLFDPKAVHVENNSLWTSRITTAEQITESLWILVSRGLVYVALPFSRNAEGDRLELANCIWKLTAAGRAAALGEDVNPDDEGTYLRHLRETVPDADALVFRYATEALSAFRLGCYLASAVMLGVASEAAVLETADAFVSWLPTTEASNLREILESRVYFSRKFVEFRKRLEAHRTELPPDLQDGLEATLVTVGELLRADRNDSGHPTGKRISRERQHGSLTIFVPYVQRLYALRDFFSSTHTTPAKP